MTNDRLRFPLFSSCSSFPAVFAVSRRSHRSRWYVCATSFTAPWRKHRGFGGKCRFSNYELRITISKDLLRFEEFQFAVEGFAADVEEAGGAGFVAVGVIEGSFDHLFLDLVHGCVHFDIDPDRVAGCRGTGTLLADDRERFKSAFADRLRQVVKLDLPARRDDHGAFDSIFKLADIAGPFVIDQGTQRLFGDARDETAGFFLVALEEMKHERVNVFDAFAKRRQRYRKHREAVKKVFAKTAFLDRKFEVDVSSGDDADIGINDLIAADARDLAVLQHAKQPHLGAQRHFA